MHRAAGRTLDQVVDHDEHGHRVGVAGNADMREITAHDILDARRTIVHGNKRAVCIKPGERIAQLVIQRVEVCEFVEVDELPDSARGEGGFGSTGTAS